MAEIITLITAALICMAITVFCRWYVKEYCADNPEIIWIWLDDEDDHTGLKEKEEHSIRIFGPAACPAGMMS